MLKKRNLDPVWGWMYILFGVASALDVSLEHPYDGFFLRDTYSKNDIIDTGSVSKTFVVNQPSNLYKIKLQNGPFESQQTLSKELLDAVYARSRKNSSLMHRSIINDMDVSAHIVSKDISPKVPRLQVLVHASPNKKVQASTEQETSWCAQVFVEANGIEYNAVCILSEKEQVCVAGIDLPSDWWTVNGSYARVSYSFTGIDQSTKCASASNNLIPVRNETGDSKQEISVLHLKMDEKSFDEWKDQDILIDVPREMFHESDTFEIPIRVEKNSDLQVFVMRAKIRQGLRITGAMMTDPSSQWSIHVDIKEHQKVGTVTAYVRDKSVYKKSQQVQDVFRWQMEVVEEGYDFRDTGRVVWSIEYQRDERGGGRATETFTAQESKIVSQINIRSKLQQRLVPVLKVTEIVNVAILTGRTQEYPLEIYAVDDTDKFSQVTAQTKCHSVEVDVLKVASDCSSLYVDGAESRGSHNVTIIAKSGHTTAFVDIAVWVPEERPELELSDFKLSRVRNWKVYREEPSRSKRGSDDLPDDDHESDDEDFHVSRKCELKRQQSTVEVYTRFYIQTPKQTDFYLGEGAFLKVTDLVKSRLRMSDEGVATLSGNMIRGKEEGRTEIQLLSPRNGHVLAVREIIVSHEKVNVEGLNLKLVTGTSLFVEPSTNLDGALVAIAILDHQFLNNNQEGIIDVEIEYSDGTTLSLQHVTSEDFFLEVKTTNMHVLGVVASPMSHQPHVVATGEGHADLKVLLKLSKACERKRSRILGNSSLDINVDFSQERKIYDNSRYQNDARYDANIANKLYQSAQSQKIYPNKVPIEYEDPDFDKSKMSNIDKKASVGVLQLNSDFEDAYVQIDEDGTKQEPLRTKTSQGMTPMQIGMYVLLAVFCVALTVFMVNCVVFFVRYKRKQRPKKDTHESIKNANDWVWIGRATLERNSVYTRSSRTLMPEEDFNGNVNSTRPLSTGSSSSGSTSGIHSGQNSNRNSTVSTYKGSECSIRITANPLTEEGGAAGPGGLGGPLPEETVSEGGGAQWDYEAMGMNYNQLLDYFDNLKESEA